MRTCVWALLLAAACSSKSSPPAGQTYAEAMKIVCDGAGKPPGYFTANLTNTEVSSFMATVGNAAPSLRAQRVHEAIEKAGLTSCPYFESIPPTIPLPTVPDTGLVALPEAPALVISPTAIVIEGQSIVAVVNGDVDAAEKEGGALGIRIPRVATFMKALVEATPSGPPVTLNLLVDPATPYKLLVSVMFSAKSAPIRTFALAVRAGTAIKAIVIELPDAKAMRPDAPALAPADQPVEMAVAITKDKVLVWSISGLEGTLQNPKLVVPFDRVTEVTKALTEIATRRRSGKTHEETEIVVLADQDVSVQKLAEVMAAVKPVSPISGSRRASSSRQGARDSSPRSASSRAIHWKSSGSPPCCCRSHSALSRQIASAITTSSPSAAVAIETCPCALHASFI